MSLDGDSSLARPLGGGGGMPIEFPPEKIVARPERGRWAALVAFAIVGSTGILFVTGLGEVHGSAEYAWRDRKDQLELEVPITDGPVASAAVYAIKVDGLPAIGRTDAKVTLVALTDYECTNCETARSIVFSLRGSYGDDLRIVWKPIARNPRAIPSLVGACAAALQGEFERYDAAIWRLGPDRAIRFAGPVELPDGAHPSCVSEPSGCREVTRTARDLGLDGTRFASAMKRCAATVGASRRELEGLDITSATYFVNGRMVDPWATESAATFQNLIDVELAKARQRIAAGASQDRYYEQWVLDVGRTTR